MILTDVHRRELQIRIQRFIGAGPSLDNIVELVGLAAVDRLAAQTGPAATARWIVGVATAQPSPALLVAIVGKVAQGGDSPELTSLAEELVRDPTCWAMADSEDLWVPLRRPFLDRQTLRAHLLDAAAGLGPPVITVEAPTGHGKRTMAAFIEAVSSRKGVLQPVVRELAPDPTPGLLDAVVADLRSALHLPIAHPSTHDEPEREAVVLARDLTREASTARSSAWFVAQLPTAQGLEAGVLRFIDELIGLIQQRETTAKHLRVTLMTTNTTALGLVNLPPPEARFVLPEVNGDSITDWFSAAVPGKPHELYEVATETVLANLAARNAAPARRLEWLATHCVEGHRLLLAEA